MARSLTFLIVIFFREFEIVFINKNLSPHL
jgi:hypothetical protein